MSAPLVTSAFSVGPSGRSIRAYLTGCQPGLSRIRSAEARITGTADRSFILGSWQIEQLEQAARKANPEPVKTGKVKAPRKSRKAKPEPTATDKRRATMSLDDYYREQKACGGRS